MAAKPTAFKTEVELCARVYKQIRADAGKWMLKEEARKPEQLALLA